MQAHEEFYSSASGHHVFRRHYAPTEDGSPLLGTAVFVHGLGDHGGRYWRVLEHFVRRGIHCIAVDLPGHGRTSGKRGFIPSLKAVHQIISENLEMARATSGRAIPSGLLGHSMGGFLALDYLARHPDQCDFSWVSSPLMDARWNRGRWLQMTARLLGVVTPQFSIHSGFRSGASSRDPERILRSQSDPLMHRRVTMRLGKLLLDATGQLPKLVNNMNSALRLLITHGSVDCICPSDLSQSFFDQLPLAEKRYALLDGMLHEPFNDIGREAFFDVLNTWLDDITHGWPATTGAMPAIK